MASNLFSKSGPNEALLQTKRKNYTSSKVGPNGFNPGYISGTEPTPEESCPTPTSGPTVATATSGAPGGSGGNTLEPSTPFIKEIITKEKQTVEKLLANAAKISPMADFIVKREEASDAAFETAEPISIPGPSKTLQGIALFFFFGTYMVLLIVLTTYIHTTMNDIYKTGMVIGIFLIGGAIILSLLVRLG
jgi:hypothetical protein